MNIQVLNVKNYIKQELFDVCLLLWKKFDKGNRGLVPAKDLGTMLRLLNYNPTEKELKEMLEKLENEEPNAPKGEITKEGFLSCVARKERDSDSIEEFIECFKLFDPQNTGLIEEKLLRFVLCKMGDGLSNDEMDNVMKEATPYFLQVISDVNYLKYVDFARYLKELFKPEPIEDPKKKGKGKGARGGRK